MAENKMDPVSLRADELSSPGESTYSRQPPPQSRSPMNNLRSEQFGNRVRADMERRQAGLQVGRHQAPGRHAKAYSAEEDIKRSSTSAAKSYRAKHDVLGLSRPKPVKGTVTRNLPETRGSGKIGKVVTAAHKVHSFMNSLPKGRSIREHLEGQRAR